MPSRVWKEQDSNLRIPFPPSFRLLTHYIFTDRARRLIKDIVVVIDVIYNYFPLFLSRSAIIASAMLYASFASKNLSILLIDITLPNRFFLTLILFNIDSLLHQYLHRFQCDMVSCYITFHVLYKFFIPFYSLLSIYKHLVFVSGRQIDTCHRRTPVSETVNTQCHFTCRQLC